MGRQRRRDFSCVAGISRLAVSASPAALLAASPALADVPDLSAAPIHEPNVLGVSLVVGLVIFSTIVALLDIAARKHWKQRESGLVADLESERAKLERAHVFLSAEPQIIVAWGSATSEPEIEGDISLVTDAPVPRRVLGFGAWLEPATAQRLEQCVERLRGRGEGFRMSLVSLAGRHLEAEGRAISGRAVLRIRDVSGDRMELLSLRQRHADLGAQAEALRAMLDSIAAPVWMRDGQGRLTWVNAAYARAVDAKDAAEVTTKRIELLDRDAREAGARAVSAGETWRARLPGLVSGERHLLDIVDVPARSGSVGIAQDLNELEAVRDNLEQQMESHSRTLDQLPTAVAIFDGRKRLVFHNAAYRQVWGLPQGFLDQNPTDSEILDRLRVERRLPEQADFRTWKAGVLSAYQSAETREHVWYLPDGRTLRVVSHPGPHGGVTYLYDDVSERFQIESQFNALVRVQGETLDTLQESVAVFGTDGKLKLYNPAFGQLWRLDNDALAQRPHFDWIAGEAQRLCSDVHALGRIREVVTGLYEGRMGYNCRMERKDGVVLDCAALPLPDGATLVTFIDVTAQINVERALTDRNQALIEAENLRNDFVHHISYELRSPLTNVIGFIQLLADESTGPLNQRQREYLDIALNSSSALLAIINDILDLATIDKDGMQLELENVDIAETIHAASAGVQDRLSESGIHLSVVMRDNVGAMRADGKRLRQILFALLANAINFSEPGQTVTLAALRRDGEVAFKVSDTGRGIPPDVLDKVFDRFRSHTIGARHRGVGLGLSIVKALVELHGGSVRIDSAPGEGTTVTCIFPVRDAQGQAHGALEAGATLDSNRKPS
ncbi:MAG: PAS-domain containing protein [Hyphomicrobiales bacterium]|nr:PAS-domain containing protein [Hyphomicrobiales bacterium]